jgi:hypothetical protein
LRERDIGVKYPATRKKSGMPKSDTTAVTSVSADRSGSRTTGSRNTQLPTCVHAIVVCATMTPATRTT